MKTCWAIWDLEMKQFVEISHWEQIPLLFPSYNGAVEFRKLVCMELTRYEIQEVVVKKRT